MARSMRGRLEDLEEGMRARAAAELRKRLHDISDDEIARMLVGFRRGEPEEEYMPEALADAEGLADGALGYGWWDLPEEEVERRTRLIYDEVMVTRGDGIRARVASLERRERSSHNE
jgi:hypothetical protein